MPSTTQAALSSQCNCRILAAGVSGGLGVVLGALGSHAFMQFMDDAQLKQYNVANQYHLVHSVAMLVVATALSRASPAVAVHLSRAYTCFAAGTAMVAIARYVFSTCHKPAVLDKVPMIGAAVLTAGWTCVAAAGVAATASAEVK